MMGNTPEQSGRGTARWLWAVRIAALASILMIALPFVLDMGSGGVVLALIFTAHYLLGIWWLRPQTLTKGLAVATGTGSVVFLISVFLIVFSAASPAWGPSPVAYFSSLGLVQAILVATAIRLHYCSPRERGDQSSLRKGLKYGVLYLVIFLVGFAMWIPSNLRSPIANQAAAEGLLRTINFAALSYKSTYANGFPRDLKTLGPASAGSSPSCDAANLIATLPASGKKGGYIFQYNPRRPVEKPATGCVPGVTGYSISARPLYFGQTGRRSFFTDDSGVIRWTDDNRPATANDALRPD